MQTHDKREEAVITDCGCRLQMLLSGREKKKALLTLHWWCLPQRDAFPSPADCSTLLEKPLGLTTEQRNGPEMWKRVPQHHPLPGSSGNSSHTQQQQQQRQHHSDKARFWHCLAISVMFKWKHVVWFKYAWRKKSFICGLAWFEFGVRQWFEAAGEVNSGYGTILSQWGQSAPLPSSSSSSPPLPPSSASSI